MTCDPDPSAGLLLTPDDPDPVGCSNRAGRSSFLLLGDHAGTRCPVALGDLGVAPADWQRHIACDLGGGALGERLAAALDATFLHQAYSRLVIDCNRDPGHSESIPEISDGTVIDGNAALSAAQRAQRIAEIHTPYHAAIAAELDRSEAEGRPRIVVSLHSFTPVWQGERRPWRAGVLFDGGDDAFALRTLALLEQELGAEVAANQPYAMDSTDYTIPRHAIARHLSYIELEIRQDLLATEEGVNEWSERLARALVAAQRTA